MNPKIYMVPWSYQKDEWGDEIEGDCEIYHTMDELNDMTPEELISKGIIYDPKKAPKPCSEIQKAMRQRCGKLIHGSAFTMAMSAGYAKSIPIHIPRFLKKIAKKRGTMAQLVERGYEMTCGTTSKNEIEKILRENIDKIRVI